MINDIKRDVKELATPAGRQVGSLGHTTARAYLVKRLGELGLIGYGGKPLELPYESDGTPFINILATLPGTKPDLAPVVLVAHYDTCGPYPGADDNAAAIAILLASVKPLRALSLERSIVFAFFDAEEPPHFHTDAMGSTHFYHHQRIGPVHCAVVLDLVGHDVPIPGLQDLVFITGMESDKDLTEVMKAAKLPEGIRIVPTLNRYIGDMSDHHVFRLNQRPYLFLSCGHWEHYHQPTDTPEKLNYEKVAAITAYVCALTQEIAGQPLAGPFEGYDSTSAEIAFLRKTVGPFLETLGVSLESRRDIDTIAQLMMGQFGL
jgi:Peptidase family M28